MPKVQEFQWDLFYEIFKHCEVTLVVIVPSWFLSKTVKASWKVAISSAVRLSRILRRSASVKVVIELYPAFLFGGPPEELIPSERDMIESESNRKGKWIKIHFQVFPATEFPQWEEKLAPYHWGWKSQQKISKSVII